MAFRVLVVDDERLSRIVLRRLVRIIQPAWECLEAVSAEDAWLVLQILDAQVAIVNSDLLGHNGLDLAGALRRAFPDMPIAIVAGDEGMELIDGAARAHILRQPVTEDQLRVFLSQPPPRAWSASPCVSRR